MGAPEGSRAPVAARLSQEETCVDCHKARRGTDSDPPPTSEYRWRLEPLATPGTYRRSGWCCPDCSDARSKERVGVSGEPSPRFCKGCRLRAPEVQSAYVLLHEGWR